MYWLICCYRCEVIICPEYPAPSRADILSKISGVNAVLWFSREKIDKQMLDTAGNTERQQIQFFYDY